MGPSAELRVSDFLWNGPYARIFWPLAILGFGIPTIILLKPIFGKRKFNTGLTFVASIILNVAFWVKRFTIVVPSLLNPPLYQTGIYIPTLTEASIMLGTFWMAVLLYMAFIKIFPIVELDAVK